MGEPMVKRFDLNPAVLFALHEARSIIATVEPGAAFAGYIVALYGSVLRDGYGRDLDLVASPYRRPFDDDALVRAFEQVGRVIEDNREPLFGTRYVAVQVGPDRIIDLKVRIV